MYRTRPTYSLWRHPNFPKSNGGPNPHPNITPAIRPNPSRTEPGYSSSIGLYNDRRPTATQYDRLLPWHHHVRLFVCLSVTLLWLSESVYRAKTCTSVFLATNKFLFCPFRHFCCSMYRSDTDTKRPEKRIEENATTDNEACTGRVDNCADTRSRNLYRRKRKKKQETRKNKKKTNPRKHVDLEFATWDSLRYPALSLNMFRGQLKTCFFCEIVTRCTQSI